MSLSLFFVSPALVALTAPLGAVATGSSLTHDLSTATAPLPRAEPVGFLPRGLTSFGSAVDGAWLYVLGGYHGKPHEYSIEGQSGAFLRINLLDLRDVRLLGDVEPVQGAELVAWKGQMIRVAGMHARNVATEPARLESSAQVAMFDPITGVWTQLPELPAPRSSHRAVVVGDVLHVVGGWSLGAGDADKEWARTHLFLDLADPLSGWTEKEAPFQSRAAGAAVKDGHVVIVGGLGPGRSITSDVWVFDPEASTWRRGPEFPDWGFGVTATELEPGAGLAASGRSGVVYRLEGKGEAERWRACAELSHGRIFHEIEDDGQNGLVALGGIVGMETRGRVRSIEHVDLGQASPAAKACIERFALPAPCAVKNRFGIFLEGRSIYLFGGNNSLGQHDFEPENFVDETWRLDLGNLEWTKLSSLPAPRQTMQVVAGLEGERAIAVGGFGHNGEDAVSQSGSWLYDVEFGDWKRGPELIGTRTQFGLVQHHDELWVFGGLDYDPSRPEGEAFHHRRDVLRWNGQAESFLDAGVEVPEARRAFAGAALADRYYMVGGMGDGFAPVTTARVFDFASSKWSEIPAPARPRVGADLVPIEGALYLVGGRSPKAEGSGLESNPSVECYDPLTRTWSTVVKDLGMEMKHARAFALDGRLCVFTMHRGGSAKVELMYVTIGG